MINHFPETVQVLLDYGRGFGRSFAEAHPGDTIESVVENIFTGQFAGKDTYIVGVYSTGLGRMTVDISDKVCDMLMAQILKDEEPSDQAKNFLEYCENEEYLATQAEFDDGFDPDYARETRDEYRRIGL